MDLNNLRNEIKEFASKAIQYDKLKKYEEAQEYYNKAAEKLNLLIKYDESPYNQEVYMKKSKEFSDRAKILKESTVLPKKLVELIAIRNELKELKELASKAVIYDKLDEYEEAQEYYNKAAEKLNLLIKYDESPYSQEVYMKKAKEYSDRAKILKEKSTVLPNKNVDLTEIRNEIKELASKAVIYDKLDEYEEAQEYYNKAAEKLNLLIKYDESPYNQEVYMKKSKEYSDRAKILKEKSAVLLNKNEDLTDIRNELKELASKAVQCDKLEKYEEALDYYNKAIYKLYLLIKYDESPYFKEVYVKKSKEYSDRVKILKKILKMKN